jgi:hypothetical protein
MVGNIVDVEWATIKSGCLPITDANAFSSSNTVYFLWGAAGKNLLPPNWPSLATPSGPVWSSKEGAALQDNGRERLIFCPPPAPLQKYLTGCLS